MPEDVAVVQPVMVISEPEPAPVQEPDLQEAQPLPVAVATLDVSSILCIEGAPEDDDDDDDDDGDGDMEDGPRLKNSKLGVCKKAWTAAEDKILQEVVEKNGAHRWSTVAGYLPGRMGKQCRERWFNHLCPDVKKGSWTADEDRVIMESVREFGTRWSHIVKLMPGRTDNAIKNRYNSAMRRAKRLQRLHEASGDAEATPPHITPELLMPKPKAKPPASPGGDNTPGKKAKRKRESQENTTANFGADDVPPQLTSADDEPSMAVSDGGEGVAVVINAGSLASLGLGMGKTDEEEGKAKGAKKRRPSRARSKGAQGAGSISSGSVLDENLQGPGGAAGLSPQHLAQLAQMLKAGGENAPANQSELLELLASQMPSPLGGTLGSPMQAVLEAGLLAHGNREDGSPFDFNAALQDLSPGTFGAASALPQLISASPMPAPPAELRGAAEAAGKLAAAAEAAGKQRGKAAAKATPQKAGACAGAAGGGEGSSGERRLSGASPAGASPAGVSPGSLFAMLDGLDDRALCGELKAGDQAELKVGTPSLLMPPPPPPPPRNTPATKTDPSSGLRVSSSDDWMSAYNSNSKASPPQMLLSEQLSPVHSPHLTDFLTTGF